MLCRVPGGIEEAREAGDLLRQAEEKVDNNVKIATAAVKRAKGIWHGCMAMRGECTPSCKVPFVYYVLKIMIFRHDLNILHTH